MITYAYETFDAGEVAWILCGLFGVLGLLWPGMSLLYAGLLGRPAPVDLMRRWPALLAVLTLAWGGWIYSLAFAPSWGTVPVGSDETAPVLNDLRTMLAQAEEREDHSASFGRGGISGGLDYVLLRGVSPQLGEKGPLYPTRPPLFHLPQWLLLSFHMMLFVAAAAPLPIVLWGRHPFGVLLAFIVLWGTLTYAPLIHWIWGEGWLAERGALDFAGGVWHIAVGFSGLSCAIMASWLHRSEADAAGLAPGDDDALSARGEGLAALGVVLVWIGALAVHAAAAWKPDGQAAGALLNSQLAASAGLATWWLITRFVSPVRSHMPAAVGAIAGLAAVAPNCGLVVPQSALVIGIAGGAAGWLTYAMLPARPHVRAAWTVFALHGIPGAFGLVLTGVFTTSSLAGFTRTGASIEGLVGGDSSRILAQGIAAASIAAWALASTLILLLLMSFVAARFDPARGDDQGVADQPEADVHPKASGASA